MTPMKLDLTDNLQEMWRHQHNKWGENRNYCHEIKSVFSRSVMMILRLSTVIQQAI